MKRFIIIILILSCCALPKEFQTSGLYLNADGVYDESGECIGEIVAVDYSIYSARVYRAVHIRVISPEWKGREREIAGVALRSGISEAHIVWK